MLSHVFDCRTNAAEMIYIVPRIPFSTYEPGEHSEEAGCLTKLAGPPRVGMDDVDAAVVSVHRADDEQVETHQEVGTTEVDDEEGRRLRSVSADPPDDDE